MPEIKIKIGDEDITQQFQRYTEDDIVNIYAGEGLEENRQIITLVSM